MKATSINEAWAIANRLFPTDYMKNEESSKRAGYPVYETTSTDEKFAGFHISDLNTRLELNMGKETVTIWIEESEEDYPEVTITLKDGHSIVYKSKEKATVNFVNNGHIRFYNVTVGQFITSYRTEQIKEINIRY